MSSFEYYQNKAIWFGICWIHNLSKDEDNYDTQTWFGADPTFMHKSVRWSILDGKLNYDGYVLNDCV